ncbi:hypothetical protein C8F04DRAFT_1200694 [Mycena alexandri]|uniref:Uncharacterized protein n=1 Tax=Mycena alexandri TaxID=1745969 RepID=A0AAD6RXR6_9AGAR|nr:hypothetical protein C8F04DRAFT_1200694 [Mycena alexandri]
MDQQKANPARQHMQAKPRSVGGQVVVKSKPAKDQQTWVIYLYRRVVLTNHNAKAPWSFEDAIRFFSTVALHSTLAYSVRTMQLTFNMMDCTLEELDPLEENLDMPFPPSTPLAAAFWASFQRIMPRLTRLETLNLSFDHDDRLFLRRFLVLGNLETTLPSCVKKIHLKPLGPDYHLEDDELLTDWTPWDREAWAGELARIPHIKTLLVTSPTYVVWPPTNDGLDAAIRAWTGSLSTSSGLQEVVLNFAFGDEGEQIRALIEEDDDAVPAPFYEPIAEVGGSVGLQLLWRRVGEEWQNVPINVASESNRAEYFFGPEGQGYNNAWLWVEDEKDAQTFRQRSQARRREGRPGWRVVY